MSAATWLSFTMSYQHKEDQLLVAIETGNMERVKQLLSSGIGLNTVLHSTTRRESATVLGTAAYEGQLEIMRYLIAKEVTVNYQDPWLSQNALHWACMGGSLDAVLLLLAHNIDVNCLDRDNVTPIIRAAMFGRTQVVAKLIEHGAHVNLMDRLHSSVLHYASFHGQPEIVSLVIRAGCIANNSAIFGQGTPLANLVFHGDLNNIKLLVESGYSLKNDSWILNRAYVQDLNKDTRIANYLLEQYTSPTSLQGLCRAAIRKLFVGPKIVEKLKKLPLPSKITEYLTLDVL